MMLGFCVFIFFTVSMVHGEKKFAYNNNFKAVKIDNITKLLFQAMNPQLEKKGSFGTL